MAEYKNEAPDMNDRHIPTGLPGGFFIYNAQGDEEILFAEDNVIRLFGCETMAEFRLLTHNSFRGMVYEEDLENVENSILSQTSHGEKHHDYVRYRIKTRTGDIRYVEDFGHLMHGENGTSYFYVFIIDIDMDDYLNRTSDYSEVQALHTGSDSLTGLRNMAGFYAAARQLMADPASRNRGLSFIHFDIANFKLYNERYGFQKGNDLLRQAADSIRRNFEDGLAARLSNDHFVVCTFANDVSVRVEAVHEELKLTGDGARVEIKAGIYRLADNVTEVGIACDHARLACNNIKKRYDISYCVYDSVLSKRARQQQYIVDHIDQAIAEGHIQVYYQPVIRVKTEEICGYEALARWIDPGYGILSPADFIETLEQFHLIHKLDGFVVRRVCEDYRALKERGEPLVPVSINLSRLDFQLCNIFEVVDSTRREFGMPKEMLDVEITESALNDSSGFMSNEIRRFHEQGYQIWIDDFGSGYSSLNVLAEYTFDVLKLDMKFLRSYDSNPKTSPLLYYIVFVAQELGVQSLTEGVETLAHFDFLKKIGCEKAQGYLFGKPLPLEETRAATRAAGMRWEQQAPQA